MEEDQRKQKEQEDEKRKRRQIEEMEDRNKSEIQESTDRKKGDIEEDIHGRELVARINEENEKKRWEDENERLRR